MRDLIRTHPFQAASAVVMMVLLGTTAYLVVTLIDTRSDQSNTAADVRIIKASPCTADPASRACGRLRREIRHRRRPARRCGASWTPDRSGG